MVNPMKQRATMEVWVMVHQWEDDADVKVAATEKVANSIAFDIIKDMVMNERDYFEEDNSKADLLEAIDSENHQRTVELWDDTQNKITVFATQVRK